MCCFSFLYYTVVTVECKILPLALLPWKMRNADGSSWVLHLLEHSLIQLIYNKTVQLTMVLAVGRVRRWKQKCQKKSGVVSRSVLALPNLSEPMKGSPWDPFCTIHIIWCIPALSCSLSYLYSCKMDQMCRVLHNIFILKSERQFASINLETGL